MLVKVLFLVLDRMRALTSIVLMFPGEDVNQCLYKSGTIPPKFIGLAYRARVRDPTQ